MKMEDMFNKMNICDEFIDSVAEKLDNAAEVKWGAWENHSVEYFFMAPTTSELSDKKYVVTASWCFDKLSYDRIAEISEYCAEHSISIISMPEVSMFILCKNADAYKDAFKKLPQELIEKSAINIKDVEFVENGVIFNYYNKTSFVEYDERPEYVYELIEEERNKENGN
jgi:hypothetical protein